MTQSKHIWSKFLQFWN